MHSVLAARCYVEFLVASSQHLKNSENKNYKSLDVLKNWKILKIIFLESRTKQLFDKQIEKNENKY